MLCQSLSSSDNYHAFSLSRGYVLCGFSFSYLVTAKLFCEFCACYDNVVLVKKSAM